MEKVFVFITQIFNEIIRYILTAQVKVNKEYEQTTQKRMVLIHENNSN